MEDVCRNKGRSEELQGPHCGDLARGAPLRKPSRWDGDIGARGDIPSAEVCETQERLDVLSFSWCRVVANNLDLRGVHSKAARANKGTKAVRLVHAESALLDFGV